MLVQTICEVPDDLFIRSLNEISTIDWSSIDDPSRKTGVFNASTAIHLRIHKVDPNNKPKSIREYCAIVDCADVGSVIDQYPETYKLANWICETVKGIRLGRIMIVRLEAGGSVGLHQDPYEYFETYSRYHVPLITNPLVVFNDEDNVEEHVAVKTLARLNNRKPHAVANNSSTYRVHVIVDVELPGGNVIF